MSILFESVLLIFNHIIMFSYNSAAVLQSTDSLGSGMVKDGTKCGDKKV